MCLYRKYNLEICEHRLMLDGWIRRFFLMPFMQKTEIFPLFKHNTEKQRTRSDGRRMENSSVKNRIFQRISPELLANFTGTLQFVQYLREYRSLNETLIKNNRRLSPN